MSGKIYDAHCHFILPEYAEAVTRNYPAEDGFPIPQWSVEEQLDMMDSADIAWSLLGLSSPHPHYHNDKKCIALMRKMNEDLAELKRRYPDRLGFAAALPHPNNDAAVEEAIYALDVLGANAIKLASNSRGLYMGDAAMEPLMAELNKRNAILVMHPHRPSQIAEDVFTASVAPMFEFICDTTRAVVNMIFNGVFERYPNITLVVPHNGSFLPNIYPRMIMIVDLLVKQGVMDYVDVKKSFAGLYFDTSGNTDPNTELLLTCASPDRIMYGSDFPFTPKPLVQKMLADTQQLFATNLKIAPHADKILAKNCKNLFKLA